MYVSALLLHNIANHCRERGISDAALLSGTGVDPALLSDPSARLPLDTVDHFVTRAMALTGDEGLGITLASAPLVGAQSMLYHLALSCSTLREAFASVHGITMKLLERAVLLVVEEGDQARYIYRSPIWVGNTSRFATELVLALTQRIAQDFLRTSVTPVQVSFRHAYPSYAARYADVFRGPIEFGAKESCLVFPRELLDQKQLLGNSVLRESLEQTASRVLAPRGFEDRVSERIRVLLRYATDFTEASSEELARRLALSERSMRRKLSQEGVSLTEVIDEVRKEIACREISDPERCISATAARLGFSERTAFHRAFKRWTGETPRSYRKNHPAAAQGLVARS